MEPVFNSGKARPVLAAWAEAVNRARIVTGIFFFTGARAVLVETSDGEKVGRKPVSVDNE